MHPDRVLLEVVDGGERLGTLVARNALGLCMNAALVEPEVVLGGKALSTVVALILLFVLVFLSLSCGALYLQKDRSKWVV